MGQRLVVTVTKDDKAICKMYYHWSAYTYSAMERTKEIVDVIYNGKDESVDELKLRLIRYCEQEGGGIDNGQGSDEWKYIQEQYPNETFKAKDIDRNYGLIALSETGMEDMQSWSEGDVEINLDDDKIRFDVFCGYEFLDQYIEERKSWDDEFEGIKLEDIPDIGCDIGYFDVDDINSALAAIESTDGHILRYGNDIYELFE